jgi:hypothetical protein
MGPDELSWGVVPLDLCACAPLHKGLAAITGSEQSALAPWEDVPCAEELLRDCEKHAPEERTTKKASSSVFCMVNSESCESERCVSNVYYPINCSIMHPGVIDVRRNSLENAVT